VRHYSAKRRRAFATAAFSNDADFAEECGVAVGSFEAEVALAVREIIADLANVPKESILARHSFVTELVGLDPALDSLDSVDYVMRLEERLDMRIPDCVAQSLPGIFDPDRLSAGFTVGQMVVETARRLKGP
jgi:acyl carrier protein